MPSVPLQSKGIPSDGTKTAIVGNSSNFRGELSYKKIEVSALHLFPVTNRRSAFHPTLALASNIPIALWDGTVWDKDDFEPIVGTVLTSFFPIYFGQTVVYGDLHNEDIANNFTQLVEGYALCVVTAIHAFKTLDDTNHLLKANCMDNCLYYNPSWTDTLKPFAPNSPCGTTINVQSSQFPQEANLINHFSFQ